MLDWDLNLRNYVFMTIYYYSKLMRTYVNNNDDNKYLIDLLP